VSKSRIIGMGDCLATLAGLKKATATAVGRRALLPAAEILRAEVERRAPLLTGDLKASVRVIGKSQSKRRRRGAVDVTVIADDIAAVTNEFGTSDTPIQPFFRPAIDATREAMFDAVARDLTAETTKAAERVARRKARTGA
jgi:HK97 gp10 family phage protein